MDIKVCKSGNVDKFVSCPVRRYGRVCLTGVYGFKKDQKFGLSLLNWNRTDETVVGFKDTMGSHVSSEEGKLEETQGGVIVHVHYSGSGSVSLTSWRTGVTNQSLPVH